MALGAKKQLSVGAKLATTPVEGAGTHFCSKSLLFRVTTKR